MHLKRFLLLSAAGLAVAVAAPGRAQDAAAPAADTPAAETPAAPAPDATATPPAPDPSAPAVPPALAAPAAPGATQAPAAPAQPEIAVTQHGEWEVGCIAGTTNCEMQQVALDASDNPVILVRLLRLPAGSEAEALAIFNTPLGTLLPTGLGFQIDSGQAATLPFEWCVQEGCVVRLGLREPEITAMKRGATVKLVVSSIADANAPVELSLSLTGFTAAYDSLGVPPAQPAPAAPAPAPSE